MDVKTPSSGYSGENRLENLELLRNIDEIKFVISNIEDYIYTKNIINKYYSKGKINISGAYGTIDYKKLINIVLKDRLDLRIQIQLHKHIWDENQRGV